MKIYFSTVVRKAPIEQGGEIICLDWSTKTILAKKTLVPFDPDITTLHDPNPRGNTRGGRGIVRQGKTIFVATYHSVLLFDTQLEEQGRISNNLFVELHEMCQTEENIWLASTAIDGAICIDTQGNQIQSWWPRENPKLQSLLGLEPLSIDKSEDNRLVWINLKPNKQPSHTHLNAVAVHKGHLHILLNRFGVVYNTVTEQVLIDDKSIAGCHNLMFLGNRILINDSKGKSIKIYSMEGDCVQTINLLDFPEIEEIYHSAESEDSQKKRLFVRGLSRIDDNRILVGFSPATIVEIELSSSRLLDLFQYSQDVAVCVHGLLAC